MDSKKVGGFIAEIRREKGLTQKQLAERLSVTDKAISRWETGKGYPDIELLGRLSEVLEVSLNELLSGERLEKEELIEVCEKNVTEAYTKVKTVKKRSKILIGVCILLGLSLCVSVALYCIYDIRPKDSYTLTSSAGDRDTVMSQVTDFLSDRGYLSMETVCIMADLNIPKKDSPTEKISGEIRLHCRDMHRDISILISPDEEGESTVTKITYTESFDEVDGVAADVLFDYIGALDPDYFIDSFAQNKRSSRINVYVTNLLYWTFSDKQTVGFGNRQHRFDGEKINRVFSSEGMSGKYYESVITAGDDNVSCGSVYIAR